MAPFNAHFLVAEQVWTDLFLSNKPANQTWRRHYGQFCFGCVACDVDKASKTLSQKDTHFYDRSTNYELMATSRSAAFLARQDQFLVRPFACLPPEAQAFVLGYLCHLCLDEVSKHLWRRRTWLKFWDLQPGSAFAALDETARSRIEDYEAIVTALHTTRPLDVIIPIPLFDLRRMLAGVQAFAAAETVEDEYLALVDLFNANLKESHRQRLLAQFQNEIDAARRKIRFFELDRLVSAGAAHSRRRISDLMTGRAPSPGYPNLNNCEL